MMTTKEKLVDMLFNHGMSEDPAKEVVELAIPKIEQASPDSEITWDRPAGEYPDVMYNIFWLTLKETALEWIDKNAPQAWYRACFE